MSQDSKKCPITHLTTEASAPVVDNQNSMTTNTCGLLLAQGLWLDEKLADFVREAIPERRMHAKGSGAFGTFTVTNDITQCTRAKIFSEIGRKTKVFARFLTVASEHGAADTERDTQGSTLKFYTEEGNWDLVGNNTPMFFLRDARKFPNLNRIVKRGPRANKRSATNDWDFWALLPKALHQATIVMSDRDIPTGCRHMHDFGGYTFSFINTQNEHSWVKFHMHTRQGIQNLTDIEVTDLIAKDRESSQIDLFDAIERDEYPEWKMHAQTMPELEVETVSYHPFDLTRAWPKGDHPLIEISEFELNRNPENYFQDIKRVTFAPSNLIPGISYSPDRMLRARLMNYANAARYHVDVNHSRVPVNATRCPVNSNCRDGQGCVDGDYGSLPYYEPNSLNQWQEQPRLKKPALRATGDTDFRDFRGDDNDYLGQSRALFNLVNGEQKQALFNNTAAVMDGALDFIKYRHIRSCCACDPACEQGVARALGMIVVNAQVVREADSTKGLPSFL